MPLTVLICDDHALFREGLAMLLERRDDWRVVAQAVDGAEAVRLARALKPNLAVLDVSMPAVSGLDAAVGIRRVSPGTHIVALSMYGDQSYLRRMQQAGAAAYVLKSDISAELVAAIEAVLRGETYLSPALRGGDVPRPSRCAELELKRLTAREREVFQMLATGKRAKAIAETLGISTKTVETHRANIMVKIGADSVAELVKIAVRAGVVGIE